MADKGIFFNAKMVRAILDGRKTVTRRVVKLPYGVKPYRAEPQPEHLEDLAYWDFCYGVQVENGTADCVLSVKAPYRPGNILYVRETFSEELIDGKRMYVYKTHDRNRKILEEVGNKTIKWTPSIHMPKDAARIFLKVTEVRVERLQKVNFFDCINEGIPYKQYEVEIIKDFANLWDCTVKPADRKRYGWDANPWVFAISFERMEKMNNLPGRKIFESDLIKGRTGQWQIAESVGRKSNG